MNTNMTQDPLAMIEAVEQEIQAEVNPVDVEIEGFTFNDFATEKPYLFILMNHGNSETVLQGLKMKLEAQSTRCKVKARAFETMCKKTFQEHSDLLPQNTNGVAANVCAFDGLDQFGLKATDIKCTGYKMDMNGVGTVANFKGIEIPVKVCPHPILITKRYENVLSAYETVDISYYRDGRWKTLRQMALSDVYSATKIVGVLASRGVSVTSETAKAMVTFLQETYDANRALIRSVRTTDVIGWQPDGTFAPYTSAMEIDAGGDTGELAAMAAALRTEGDPDVWVNGVKAIRAQANSLPVRMMMAASFSAPLLEKLALLPYWTHMVGNGSTGKTVTMRLVSTIWGYSPVAGGWMKTMNGTTCAIEELAGFAHNLPLCLNELQTIQAEKNFAQRVYDFCEGQGRNRGRRAGGLRDTKKWFCNALSCGEQSIVTSADRGGANSRVIEIPVTEKMYTDPQTFCSEVLDKSYGHAGKMFIEGLYADTFAAVESIATDANPSKLGYYEKNSSNKFTRSTDTKAVNGKTYYVNACTIADVFSKFKAEVIATAHRLEAQGKNEKQADAAAVLLLADRLAEKYVFHDGKLIAENEIVKYLKDKDEINDNLKGYEALRNLIVEKNANFASESNKYPKEVWGKTEDNGDTVYFVKGVFDREMKELGYDAKRFTTWCSENGVLAVSGRYGHEFNFQARVVPGANAVWCYKFTFKDDTDPTRNIPKGSSEVTDDDPVQTELPF